MTLVIVVALLIVVAVVRRAAGGPGPVPPRPRRTATCAGCGHVFDVAELRAIPGVEGLRCPTCWADIDLFTPRT